MKQTILFRLLVVALVLAGGTILVISTRPRHAASTDDRERLPNLETPSINR